CFFFQAEDGIRDKLVTGVQTCALPILFAPEAPSGLAARTAGRVAGGEDASGLPNSRRGGQLSHAGDPPAGILGWSLADLAVAGRSEERRVGKGGWSRGCADGEQGKESV